MWFKRVNRLAEGRDESAEKLRVAFIGSYHPTYRLGMYRALCRDHGLAITLVSAINNKSALPTIQSGDVPCVVEEVPEWRFSIPLLGGTVGFKPAMVGRLIRGTHDVYVMPSALSHLDVWLSLFLARLLGRRVCLWGHGYGPADGRASRWLRRMMIALSSAHIFYSEPMRDCWAKRGVRASKLFVAPNALDTEESQRIRALIAPGRLESFQRIHKLVGKRAIVFVGRMSQQKPGHPHDKRPEILVRAMARVVRDVPDAHLVMIGGGSAIEGLKHLALELGLLDSISFTGPIFDEQEIALYLLSAKAAAMPGWAGLFVNHVFDYGLPIVIGRLAVSPPETALVEDGVTGIVSSPDDPEEFGSAIVSLLQSPERCAEMGAAARSLIRSTYNVQAMAAGMSEAIHAVAPAKSGIDPTLSRKEAPWQPHRW